MDVVPGVNNGGEESHHYKELSNKYQLMEAKLAEYRQQLEILMTGDDTIASATWPDAAVFDPPLAHYSAGGVIADPAALIERAASDRKNHIRAICVIEGLSAEYACELGTHWSLDPAFFAEHLRPLQEPVAYAALVEGRNPNSGAGLKSYTCGPWGTVRGVIDHGRLPDNDDRMELEKVGNRVVKLSYTSSYAPHTNISYHKVNECLDLILVDKLPPYHYDFEVDSPAWLPYQSVLRLATLLMVFGTFRSRKCSGRSAQVSGQCGDSSSIATNQEVLLQSIRHEGFDGFMYKASPLECECHLSLLSQEISRFNYDEIYNGGMETNRKLHAIRKVLYRLKSCFDGNLAYEERLRRVSVFKSDLSANANAATSVRRDFEGLSADMAKLERLLESCFQLLMSTMSAKNSEIMRELGEANRKQTQAMVEQTHTMTMLSWMAFFYIPLTLATGIFGMNLKEINDSPLSL